MPFKTFFSRPSYFRFEWTSYLSSRGTKYVIWSDGNEAFTYWEPDRYEKERDLSMAIAGGTGISSGSIYTISSLLRVKDIDGYSVTELRTAALVGIEGFEGTPCYRIKGTNHVGEPTELWIGTGDLLLRKVREESKNPTYNSIQEEVRRNIRTNQSIAHEVFEFKPPIPLTAKKEDGDETPSFEEEAPNWTEFHSEPGRFSILLPRPPTSRVVTVEAPQATIEHHLFRSMGRTVSCVIQYSDLPKQFTADPNQLFNETRDEFVRQTQARLSGESAVSQGGYSGREIRLDAGSLKTRARFFLVDQRLYQLALTVFDEEGSSDKQFERFFNSLKVSPSPKVIALLRTRPLPVSPPRRSN